jgi:hypothetical protein
MHGFPNATTCESGDRFCTVGVSFVNSDLFDVAIITGEMVRRPDPRQSPISRHCAGGPPQEGTGEGDVAVVAVDQHSAAGVHELGHRANPEHAGVGTRHVDVIEQLVAAAAHRVKFVRRELVHSVG